MNRFLQKVATAFFLTAVVSAFVIIPTVSWIESQAAHTDRPDSSQKSYTQQGGTVSNSATTSADDTAIVVTLAGVAGQNVHVYSIDMVCETTGVSIVTIDDGATEIYSRAVTAVQTRRRWAPPLTAADGGDMVVTLAACGTGFTGTLIVQADRW